jgi:hypothetical protein
MARRFVRRASPETIKRHVLAMRPNAREVRGGIGCLIVDGDEVLSDEAAGGGYVPLYATAWRNAFEYLKRKYREGALQ